MHLKYYEDNVAILDCGEEKYKGSVSWCLSEVKMGLSLQYMGERVLREPKALHFSQRGK